MLRAELKKLFSYRVIWILLVCLLCVNGYIKVTSAYDRYYTPAEYTAYLDEIKGKNLQEIIDYTNGKIDAVSENPEENTYYNGYLYYDTIEIAGQLLEYPEYLESIEANAENMASVSIWGGQDTFSYRNIQKTPPAYESMAGTTLTFDTSLGVEDFLSSPLTDILALILLFLCISSIFLRDREQGMIPLLYATKNGRTALLLTKFLTAGICCVGLVLVFYGEIFCVENLLYGFGDLSRPIQCVYGYYTCNLPISVGEYMVLYLLLKVAAYLVFAGIFGLICTFSKNNLSVYGFTAGVVGLSFLLYSKISVLSPLSLLHFWNPVQFLQGKEILGTYTNVNLFGYPVSLKISGCIVIAIFLAVCLLGSIAIFTHTRNLQYKFIHLKQRMFGGFHAHGRFWHTCHRILILQKGLIIVFAAAVVAAGMYQTFSRSYNNEDIYYENFCEAYEGKVTDETLQFLADKRAHYAEVEQQITELESTGSNLYQLNLLYAEFNDRNAFEKFAQRVESIPENGEIFYDTGYARYFALDGNQEGMVQILFLTIALVLLCSPVVSHDKQTNMTAILFSTKVGKRGYFRQFFGFAAIAGVVLTLLLTLPYFVQILERYGSQGFDKPLASMTVFADGNTSITVGMAMIRVVLIRMVGAVLTGCLVTWIASRCKSLVTAYCVGGVAFVLPIGLCLLGLTAFRFVGVMPVLYGMGDVLW